MENDPDYTDDFDSEDSPFSYTPKTLSPSSSILIETTTETLFIGTLISPIPELGLLLQQEYREVSAFQFSQLEPEDLTELHYASPIETFIPFSSVHYIQSISDLTEANLFQELRDDLDRFGHKPKPAEPEPEPEPSPSPWQAFLERVDRVLRFFGV